MEEVAFEEIDLDKIDIDDKKELLNRIMNCYGQDILQLVYSYVQNHTISEDLTQEIFIKCYRSLHTYKNNSKLRTWLWRIAINHCKDYFKSWHHRNVQYTNKNPDDYTKDMDSNVEKSIMKRHQEELLAEAIMNLPIKYKEVIYLFYFEERSIKEIFEITQVKESTIKTRLRRGKELIKEKLGGA